MESSHRYGAWLLHFHLSFFARTAGDSHIPAEKGEVTHNERSKIAVLSLTSYAHMRSQQNLSCKWWSAQPLIAPQRRNQGHPSFPRVEGSKETSPSNCWSRSRDGASVSERKNHHSIIDRVSVTLVLRFIVAIHPPNDNPRRYLALQRVVRARRDDSRSSERRNFRSTTQSKDPISVFAFLVTPKKRSASIQTGDRRSRAGLFGKLVRVLAPTDEQANYSNRAGPLVGIDQKKDALASLELALIRLCCCREPIRPSKK